MSRHQLNQPSLSPIGNPARGFLGFIAAFALLSGIPLLAHDSPEHVIEALTARMDAVGKRPDLLWRRATEHRALGQLDLAARDLNAALRARRDFLPALQDLAIVEAAQGKTNRAIRTISRAFRVCSDNAALAPIRMTRADILCGQNKLAEALADCEHAIRHGTGYELDWFLTRANLQRRLGRSDAAVEGLKDAFDRTGSVVLEAEWIDAMIDAGRFEPALARIRPHLAASRYQSSWLLRQARIRLGEGKVSEAHADLASAISELNQRLRGPAPEASLLADRSLAYALLGDTVLAMQDLAAARRAGADEWYLHRIEAILAERV